ncbi:MAG: FadR/GntR family transcriptional regulator [Microvirga sp.]
MALKPVESRRLYRQIAEQLRELIDNGQYPIGGRLPSERDLADSLHVSRPSIREALIALEVEGLVRINVGSGIYVLGTTASDSGRSAGDIPSEGSFEVLHAREVVESSLAAEAAPLAGPQHIAELDRILLRMEQCEGRNDNWIALDREFHVTLAGILENGVLVRFIGELFDLRINPYFERLASYFEDASTWRQALAEHRLIRDAIASGDAGSARSAMKNHLRLSQERFSRSFSETAAPSKAPPVLRTLTANPHEFNTKTRRKLK